MAKYKYRSGYCLNKQCEGTKPKSFTGTPMPTCKLDSKSCVCSCHALVDRMFEISGLPRVMQENPEYNPEHVILPDSVGPIPAPVTVSSSVAGTIDRPDTSDAARTPLRPAPGPPPTTATGRRPRGSLEQEVLGICQEFAQDIWEWEYCTPKLISERLGRIYSTEAPSTGAIGAVFDRWVNLKFAVCEHKPVRFVSFISNNGTWEELQNLKAQAKKKRKRIKSDLRRGVR